MRRKREDLLWLRELKDEAELSAELWVGGSSNITGAIDIRLLDTVPRFRSKRSITIGIFLT